MSLASGLGSQFGLAKESVYGTPVTVTKFFEADDVDGSLDPTYYDGMGLRANRLFQPTGRARKTTRQAVVSAPMDCPTKLGGTIFDGMHGLTVAPAQQAGTAAYKQTHNIGTSQPTKFFTLQANKPTVQAVDKAFTYPGAVLLSAAFSMDTGGALKMALSWDAQDEQSAVSSPAGPALAVATYASGTTIWDHTQATVTLNGVAVATCKAMNFQWTQPYKTDRFYLGSGALKGQPIPNGIATIEGTLDLDFYDTAAYALFLAGTAVGLVFDFQGATIASTYKEQITFTMAAVQLRGGSPALNGTDVVGQSVPFRALDDGTNAPLKLEYQSTDVTI